MIQILDIKEVNGPKKIILEALRNDPNAFHSSYDEYSSQSDLWWFNYLSGYIYGENKLFGAFEEDQLAGIVGLILNNKEKIAHVGTVVWFYVRDIHRGKGIGKSLFEHLLTHASSRENLIKLNLNVISSQEKAISMYEKNGFEIAGRLKKEMRVGDNYFDILQMEKFLK